MSIISLGTYTGKNVSKGAIYLPIFHWGQCEDERSVTWQKSVIAASAVTSYAIWQQCRKHRPNLKIAKGCWPTGRCVEQSGAYISVSPYIAVKQTVVLTEQCQCLSWWHERRPAFALLFLKIIDNWTWGFICRDMVVNERKNWKRRKENGLGVGKLILDGGCKRESEHYQLSGLRWSLEAKFVLSNLG